MSATNEDYTKMLERFDEVVGSWEPVTGADTASPKWKPVFDLLKVFPDGMHDFGHFLDELQACYRSPKVADLALAVPRSDGKFEPFECWLDLANSRTFLFPLRLGFQVIRDFHSVWLGIDDEKEERELFEDTLMEAARRNGICLNELAKDLKTPSMDWSKASQTFFQYRPIAFKTPDKSSVILLDCFVMQGADHAWHDFIWRCVKGMKDMSAEASKTDPELKAWLKNFPDTKPLNPMKATECRKPRSKTSPRKPSKTTSKASSKTKTKRSRGT